MTGLFTHPPSFNLSEEVLVEAVIGYEVCVAVDHPLCPRHFYRHVAKRVDLIGARVITRACKKYVHIQRKLYVRCLSGRRRET